MGRQFTYVSKRTTLPYQLSHSAFIGQKTPTNFSGCWACSLVQLQRINTVEGSAH